MSRLSIAMLLLCGACASAPCLAQADAVGRLFMTAADRAALDRQRNSGRPDKAASATVPAADVAAPPPVIVLNGVLTRSRSPRSVAWVDGVPQDGSLNNGKLTVKSRDAAAGASVRLPSGAQVTVKPGQQVDTATGKVRENF